MLYARALAYYTHKLPKQQSEDNDEPSPLFFIPALDARLDWFLVESLITKEKEAATAWIFQNLCSASLRVSFLTCLIKCGSVMCCRCLSKNVNVNPFTAPAGKISRLKDARTCLQTVYFLVLWHFYFNAMRFDENPFKCQCKKEEKKAY